MENLSDPQTLYQDLLQTSFEKLKKGLPKKYKELNEMILTFIDQLKQDKDRNANKYFGIFKLCIETKDTKLIETSIYYIHKLISHGFLDGNCRDFAFTMHLEENKSHNKDESLNEKRRLIDSIVESVCSCRSEKNESVQLQVIKVLLTLMTSPNLEVHGDSLQEIIHTLFTIHLSSKNSVNQTTAKTALSQIVNAIFQRMEEFNAQPGEYINRQRNLNGGSSFSSATKKLDRKSSTEQSPHSINPYPSLSPIANTSLSSILESQHHPRNTIIGSTYDFNGEVNENITNRSPQEKYIARCLEQIVDDVCIYDEKVKELQREFENKTEKEREEINLAEEIKKISFKAVPVRSDANNPKYRLIKPVKIENELGESAGTVGWCFVCRGPANLYCKETRVPLCSAECKYRHLDELHYLTNINKRSDKQKAEYIEDAQKVFVYLCKVSGRDPASDINTTALKNKTLSLELLVSIMENPGSTFVSNQEFRNNVKEYLCDSVLKNSVSPDRPVFSYSLGIFISLVNNFRDILKAEIAVFIEDIFLRMLESENSSFNYRSLALQVFYKICSKPKPVLEFYVNYDCNINSSNKFEKMVEMLCKIAQGKYSRPEYASIITANQAQQLRTLALESLVKLVKSLVQFTQDHQKKLEDVLKLKKMKSNEEETETEKEAEEKALDNLTKEVFEKMDEVDKQRTMKNELQKAIQKFNFKIKYGMKYFTKLGVINPEDAQSIALFFRNTPNLSKEKLGEYFGDEDQFNIKVLTEFTETIDFRTLTIDEGLRRFLALFDLPGEGQKIDRIIQVFSSKYFQDNPNSFKSGGAAYTLAFALIMLQTDAHSQTIKERDKMKLPAFINLTRGINDGENLPVEELTGYYNRILESPLALHAAAKSKKNQHEASVQTLRQKEEQFRLESEAMVEKGQKLIKQKQEGQYYKVTNPDYVRQLFTEIIWSPVLAVYSVLFEHVEDPKIIKLCLEGLSDAILLCGLHHMETEGNAFVSTLSKFTNLTGLREIKDKNVECIQTMLQLGIAHGGLLRKSWRYVLECISKINYYFNEYSPSHEGEGDQSEATKRKVALTQSVCEIIKAHVDLNVVNYIYSRSNTFSLEEIKDFITSLCQISEEELKSPHGPSTYSLQKIVEVAHFNVDRVKFEWSQIWNIMREHISSAAIHSTKEISFFAVDSLKQLSIKFLIKEELATLEFQKEFLKPFETIYQQVKNDDLKELILNCCGYIISHVKKNIKSGWKVIVDILGLATESPQESIVKLAFSIVVDKILVSDLDSLKDVFTDLALLLIKFAKSPHEDIAVVALKNLRSFISRQSQKEKSSEENQNTSASIGESKTFSGISDNAWKSILTALAKLCIEKKRNTSMQAIITLFEILKAYGEYFPREFWKRILHDILKPLFEKSEQNAISIRKTSISGGVEETKIDKEPLREMFSRLMDIHNFFKPKLDYFTKEMLELMVDCATQSQEMVAKISINTIRFLLNQWHQSLTKSEWETVIAAFSIIFEKTLPRQLLTYKTVNYAEKKSPKSRKDSEDHGFNSQECLTHCIVQLLMISLVKDILEQYETYFTDEQIFAILQLLNKSYKFAKDFNEQKYLRFCLWKDDSMRAMDQLPGLVKQEKEALSAYLVVLFKLYTRKLAQTDKSRSERNIHLDEFIELGVELMKSFYQKNEEYLAIISHEANEIKKHEESPRRDELNMSLDEAFKRQCHILAKQELEREILNLKAVFAQAFLPKLLTIEVSEIENKLKGLVKNLMNTSFYFVPKELAFSQHIKLNKKIYTMQDDATDTIKTLLNRYFDYSLVRKRSDLSPL